MPTPFSPSARLLAALCAAATFVPPALAQAGTVGEAAQLQGQAFAPNAARVGPVLEGVGKRDDDADWDVALEAGCYVFSGVGGPGVERLYVSLFEGRNRLAKVSAKTPLAALIHCVPAAGTYRVRATLDQGKGAFAVAVYRMPDPAPTPTLDRFVEAYASAQLPGLVQAADRFPLVPGAREQEWLAPVREGTCVTFVGLADAGAKEISLSLVHPNGKEQAKVKDSAPIVALEYCAKESGTYLLRAKLDDAGGAAVGRFEASPATGPQGLALAADLLGRALDPSAGAVGLLSARAKGGQDCDWRLPLEAGCYQLSAIGGPEAEKVEFSLTDPSGKKVLKGSDRRAERYCAAAPGLFKVRGVIDEGKGEFALGLHKVGATVPPGPVPETLCNAHAVALGATGARAEAWSPAPGAREPEWAVPLQPGTCYAFVGVGQDLKELRLTLRSPTGKEQAKSREEDQPRAFVDFCPKDPGTYKLTARVDGKGSFAVVRYERAAPLPPSAVAQPEPASRPAAPPPGFRPFELPTHHPNRFMGPPMHGQGLPPTATTTTTTRTESRNYCCINGRYHSCSAAGVASCGEAVRCLMNGGQNCTGRIDGCTADSSRNGECK